MDYRSLAGTSLFRGVAAEDVPSMLECLQVRSKRFRKGERIIAEGDTVPEAGLLLSGEALVTRTDFWGNRTVVSTVGEGGLFAEAFACLPGSVATVDVSALRDCEVLFLNMARVVHTCPSACAHHTALVRNLMAGLAAKNLALTGKIAHTAPKGIRGRVLSYLSAQAQDAGSGEFSIPFSRQELADYLNVDRSALSAELGRMRRDGLLEFRKNRFRLKRPLE